MSSIIKDKRGWNTEPGYDVLLNEGYYLTVVNLSQWDFLYPLGEIVGGFEYIHMLF